MSSKDVEDRVKLPESLRCSLGCPSLHCNANNTQLAAYMMTKLEQNIREGRVTEKIAANRTGLQKSNQNSIWVLNENVQVNSRGAFVTPDSSPYVWVPSFIASEEMVSVAQVTNKKKEVDYIQDLVSSALLKSGTSHTSTPQLIPRVNVVVCLVRGLWRYLRSISIGSCLSTTTEVVCCNISGLVKQ